MKRPYYGWAVVGACFLGTFVVYGLSYSFGVFLERMLATFGASRGATALVFGVQTVSLYVGASLIGVLVDRFGTRWMLLVGAIVTVIGLALASRVGSVVTLVLTYGVATGLGMSIVYVVSYATVTRWFDRRLGLAGGLASAGLGVGMVTVVPVATWLIAVVGWRDALLAIAGSAFAVLVLAAVVVRDSPRAAGVEPPSAEFAGEAPSGNRQSLREQYADVRPLAASRVFLLLFAGWVAIYVSLYVLLAHLVLFAVDVGISRSTGATALALLGATNAAGRIVIGYLADAAGRLRVFVACAAVMGVATLSLVGTRTALALFAVAGLYGLAYGGSGALLSPVTADLFGRANINAVFGLVSVAFAVAGLVAPPAAGATYDALGTYDPALLVAGLLALLGAGLVAVAGRLT